MLLLSLLIVFSANAAHADGAASGYFRYGDWCYHIDENHFMTWTQYCFNDIPKYAAKRKWVDLKPYSMDPKTGDRVYTMPSGTGLKTLSIKDGSNMISF